MEKEFSYEVKIMEDGVINAKDKDDAFEQVFDVFYQDYGIKLDESEVKIKEVK